MKFKLFICFLLFLFNSISQSTYTVYKSDKSVFYADQKKGNYNQLKMGKSLSTKVYVKSSKGKVVLIENSTKKVYEIEIVGTKKLSEALKSKKIDSSFESNLMQTIVNSFVSTNVDHAITRNGISERGNPWIIYKDMPVRSYLFNVNHLELKFKKSNDSIEVKVVQSGDNFLSLVIKDTSALIDLDNLSIDKMEKITIDANLRLNKEKLEIRYLDAEKVDQLTIEMSKLNGVIESEVLIQKALLLESYNCIFEALKITEAISDDEISQDFRTYFIERLLDRTVNFE